MSPQRRSRAVLVLAICAVLWSDPAFTALVCAQTPACPQHASPAVSHPGKGVALIAAVKPCCPMHRPLPASPLDTPACCAPSDTGALLPAVSVGHSRTKRALAVYASELFNSASLSRDLLNNGDQAVAYVKPVHQKKTDLRI